MAIQPNEITADSQVARIFEWRRGFNTIHLIDLGVRVGLFKAIAEAPGSTVEQLAQKLGLHAPYVTAWCKTAYGMELLDAEHGPRYRLAPHSARIRAAPPKGCRSSRRRRSSPHSTDWPLDWRREARSSKSAAGRGICC